MWSSETMPKHWQLWHYLLCPPCRANNHHTMSPCLFLILQAESEKWPTCTMSPCLSLILQAESVKWPTCVASHNLATKLTVFTSPITFNLSSIFPIAKTYLGIPPKMTKQSFISSASNVWYFARASIRMTGYVPKRK